MKNYDRIFVLYFGGGADNVPRDNANDIIAKTLTLGKFDVTTIIRLNEINHSATYSLTQYKPLARGKVGVYVVGHGTDTSESVGGCTAEDMAKTLDTLSDFTLANVTFVACHSGRIKTNAPHRFVTDFWTHASRFVERVVGYTGTVHTRSTTYQVTGDRPPDGAVLHSTGQHAGRLGEEGLHSQGRRTPGRQ